MRRLLALLLTACGSGPPSAAGDAGSSEAGDDAGSVDGSTTVFDDPPRWDLGGAPDVGDPESTLCVSMDPDDVDRLPPPRKAFFDFRAAGYFGCTSHAAVGADGVGDFNGDGFDDIAIAAVPTCPDDEESPADTVTVWVIFGGDEFTGSVAPDAIPFPVGPEDPPHLELRAGALAWGATTFGSPVVVGLGDLDDDGLDDFGVGGNFVSGPGNGFIVYGHDCSEIDCEGKTVVDVDDEFLTAERGRLLPSTTVATYTLAPMGDFDGDDKDDFVILTDTQTAGYTIWYGGDRGASFESTSVVPFSGPGYTLVDVRGATGLDFDGDGRSDIAVAVDTVVDDTAPLVHRATVIRSPGGRPTTINAADAIEIFPDVQGTTFTSLSRVPSIDGDATEELALTTLPSGPCGRLRGIVVKGSDDPSPVHVGELVDTGRGFTVDHAEPHQIFELGYVGDLDHDDVPDLAAQSDREDQLVDCHVEGELAVEDVTTLILAEQLTSHPTFVANNADYGLDQTIGWVHCIGSRPDPWDVAVEGKVASAGDFDGDGFQDALLLPRVPYSTADFVGAPTLPVTIVFHQPGAPGP